MMEREYIAFISYRHCPLDMAVAENLHKMIERYRVPKELRKEGEKDLGIVFRDRDELPLSSNLTEDIYEALDHSKFLIVVCTPDTPKSMWVDKEIEHFISKHGREKILTVLAAGTAEESIPKRITTEYAWDGKTVVEQIEPLCAYLVDEDQKKVIRNLKKEIPRLAAAILECPYDSLIQREKRYHMQRTLTVLGAVSAAVLGVALGFIIMLTEKNAQIEEQLRQSQLNESEALALISAEQLAEGDRRGALKSVLEALPSPEADRPYSTEAEYALVNALHVYREEGFVFDKQLTQGGNILHFALSKEAEYAVTMDESGNMRCFDAARGQELWSCVNDSYYYGYGTDEDRLLILGDAGYVILTTGGSYYIEIYSLLTGEMINEPFEVYDPEMGIELDGIHYSNEELMPVNITCVEDWSSVGYSLESGTFYETGEIAGGGTYLAENFYLSSGEELVCLISQNKKNNVLFLIRNQNEDCLKMESPLPEEGYMVESIYPLPDGERILVITRRAEREARGDDTCNYTCTVYDAASQIKTAEFSFERNWYDLDISWTLSSDGTKLLQDNVILDLKKCTVTSMDTEELIGDYTYNEPDTVMPGRAVSEQTVYSAHYNPATDVLCLLEDGENGRLISSPYDVVESVGWMYPWNLAEAGGNGLILIRNYIGNEYGDLRQDVVETNRERPTEYIIYSVEDDSWHCLENECSANGIPALTFGISHKWIAFADYDGLLRIYDQASDTVVRKLDTDISAPSVSFMQFLCDDSILLVRQRDGQLIILDTVSGAELGRFWLTDFGSAYDINWNIVEKDSGKLLYISDIAAQGTGLCIDMNSWTLLAEIPRMACYLPGMDAVVCTSSFSDELRILPMYSLEELIKKGNVLMAEE